LSFCFYDLALKKPWATIFQYPLAAVFLIDFHLTWIFTGKELSGDMSTNISSGPARLAGFVGLLIKRVQRRK